MKKFRNGFTFAILLAGILVLVYPGLDTFGVDCPVDGSGIGRVKYCPASVNNYRLTSRSKDEINYIVIHTVQGSLGSAVHTFSSDNLSYPRSAHYTIGKDGELVKSVQPDKIAWHAGTSPIGSGGKYESRVLNKNSIGIEHAGYVDDPEFPTREQYLASAALTRYLCEIYDIPIDRRHIVGHEEIKSAKGDPGPNWDWDYYIRLVKYGPDGQPDRKLIRGARSGITGVFSLLLLIAGAALTIYAGLLASN